VSFYFYFYASDSNLINSIRIQFQSQSQSASVQAQALVVKRAQALHKLSQLSVSIGKLLSLGWAAGCWLPLPQSAIRNLVAGALRLAACALLYTVYCIYIYWLPSSSRLRLVLPLGWAAGLLVAGCNPAICQAWVGCCGCNLACGGWLWL
jgi:hypothetical protein